MMKTKNIARRLLLLPALVGLALASCVNEQGYDTPKPKADEEATVTFALNVPGNSAPATRGLSENDETNVETIDVLLFRKDDSNNRFYWDKVLGVSLDNTPGSTKSFKAVIPVKDYSNYDISIVANAREVILGAGLTRGESKADALDRLVLDISGNADHKWGSNKIPMWGEALNVDVNENTSLSGSNAVKMTRMVSRIDVKLSKKAASGSDSGTGNGNFSLESVRLYNYSTKGTVTPDAGNALSWNASANKAITPHQPAGGFGRAQYPSDPPLVYTLSDQHSGDSFMPDSLIRAIYTLEALAGSNASLSTNTCLVIGGSYQGGSESFYRIDFAVKNDATQQYDYLNLLRNHNYIVNITKITGTGFGTPEEAFSSRPVNIEADVIDWNEGGMGNTVFDGQYMMSVNTQQLNYYAEGRAQELRIFTDYPGGWKVDMATKPLWVTVSADQGAPGATIAIDVSCDAGPAIDRDGVIWITAGRMRMQVKIVQSPDPELTIDISRNHIVFRKSGSQPKSIVVTTYPTNATVYFTEIPGANPITWRPSIGFPTSGVPNLNTYQFQPALNDVPGDLTLSSLVTVYITDGNGNIAAKNVTISQLATDMVFNVSGVLTEYPANPLGVQSFTVEESAAPYQLITDAMSDPLTILSGFTTAELPATESAAPFTFTLSPNSTFANRTAYFKVRSSDIDFPQQDIKIEQGHVQPYLNLSASSMSFAVGGAPQTVTIKTNAGHWVYASGTNEGNVIASVSHAKGTNVEASSSALTESSTTFTITPSNTYVGFGAAGTTTTETITFETRTHDVLPSVSQTLSLSRVIPAYLSVTSVEPAHNSTISQNGAVLTVKANTNALWYAKTDDSNQVSYPASAYATDKILKVTVPANNTWSNKTIKLYLKKVEDTAWSHWTTYTQPGYSVSGSIETVTLPGGSGTVSVKVNGVMPANTRFRLGYGTTSYSPEVLRSAAGTFNITINNNGEGATRTVYLQYYKAGVWTNLSVAKTQPLGNFTLSSGRVVAVNDTGSGPWSWAMGISTTYQTTKFNEAGVANYTISASTGCGAYSESGYPAGTWRLPTQAEWTEIWNNRSKIPGLVSGGIYWLNWEANGTDAYRGFNNSTFFTGATGKTGGDRVRCVRSR